MAGMLYLALLATVRGDLPVHCLHHQVAGEWIFHIGKWLDRHGRADPLCGYKRPDSPSDPSGKIADGGHAQVMPQGCRPEEVYGETGDDAKEKAMTRCPNGDPAVMDHHASKFSKMHEVRVTLGKDNGGWEAVLQASDRAWNNGNSSVGSHIVHPDAASVLPEAVNSQGAVGLWTMIYNEGFHVSVADQATMYTHDFMAFDWYKLGPDGPSSSNWHKNAKYSNCAATLIGWYHFHSPATKHGLTHLTEENQMCWWGEQVRSSQGYEAPPTAFLAAEKDGVRAGKDGERDQELLDAFDQAPTRRHPSFLKENTRNKPMKVFSVDGENKLMPAEGEGRAGRWAKKKALLEEDEGEDNNPGEHLIPAALALNMWRKVDGMPNETEITERTHRVHENMLGMQRHEHHTVTKVYGHDQKPKALHETVEHVLLGPNGTVLDRPPARVTGTIINPHKYHQMYNAAAEQLGEMGVHHARGMRQRAHGMHREMMSAMNVFTDWPTYMDALSAKRAVDMRGKKPVLSPNGFGTEYETWLERATEENLKDAYMADVQKKHVESPIWDGWKPEVQRDSSQFPKDFNWAQLELPHKGADNFKSNVRAGKEVPFAPLRESGGGEVPAARDQGPCGSCYDVAVSTMLTARLWIRYPELMDAWKNNDGEDGERDRTVSWKHNLDCNQMNQGCAGGYPYFSLLWGQDVDLPDSACYTHTTQEEEGMQARDSWLGDGKKTTMCEDLVDQRGRPCEYAVRVRSFGYIGGAYGLCSIMGNAYGPQYSCEFAMRAEMYRGGPIGVAIEPAPQFSGGGSADHVFQCDDGLVNEHAGLIEAYKQERGIEGHSALEQFSNLVRISEGEACPPGKDCYVWERVDHAIVAIGWGEMEVEGRDEPLKYWIIQNSWGERWNGDGTMKVERGTNCMAIESITIAADPVLVRRTEEGEVPVQAGPDGGLVVGDAVPEDSPLSPGDKILAVNGEKVSDIPANGKLSGRVTVAPKDGEYFTKNSFDQELTGMGRGPDLAAAVSSTVTGLGDESDTAAVGAQFTGFGPGAFLELARQTPNMRGSRQRGTPQRPFVLGL